MAIFFYTAKDKDGKSKTDNLSANSENDVVDRLQSEGYFVVNVRLAMDKSAPKTDKKRELTAKFNHDNCKIEDLLVFIPSIGHHVGSRGYHVAFIRCY